VTLWRVCRRRHAADPLSGRGGFEVGGRWHFKGTRVAYTSGTLSLAVLEMLVQVDVELAPEDLVRVEVEIPDDLTIEEFTPATLPANWQTYPAPPSLALLGTEWIRRGASAILRVPSAVIPVENNYLVNPAHGDAARIRVVGTQDLRLDPRLLR